jgi:hypothetical protein
MGPEDLKGVRLPGDPPRRDTPEQVGREVIRATFVEALGDYIDARIDYRAADPEWKSGRDLSVTADKLEHALEDVLRHG